jgi:uncharacterized protein YcbX
MQIAKMWRYPVKPMLGEEVGRPASQRVGLTVTGGSR